MDNRSSTVLAVVILAVILAQRFNLPLPWRERVGERGAITTTLPTVSPCGYEALAIYGGISLSCASAEVLRELPGIGPKTAERIIAYRETLCGYGAKEATGGAREPFGAVDPLWGDRQRVPAATGPVAPCHPLQDPQALLDIPGIGPKTLERLRPYLGGVEK